MNGGARSNHDLSRSLVESHGNQMDTCACWDEDASQLFTTVKCCRSHLENIRPQNSVGLYHQHHFEANPHADATTLDQPHSKTSINILRSTSIGYIYASHQVGSIGDPPLLKWAQGCSADQSNVKSYDRLRRNAMRHNYDRGNVRFKKIPQSTTAISTCPYVAYACTH